MIGGVAKMYNLTFGYVLNEMSYANMILYSSVIPDYGGKKTDAKTGNNEIINADDPKNRDKIKQIMFGD